MEMAQTLVRTVVRAFFSTYEERRIICIVDALVLHSALRDDDLSYLMGINTKDLSKTCAKLEEERLLRSYDHPYPTLPYPTPISIPRAFN